MLLMWLVISRAASFPKTVSLLLTVVDPPTPPAPGAQHSGKGAGGMGEGGTETNRINAPLRSLI